MTGWATVIMAQSGAGVLTGEPLGFIFPSKSSLYLSLCSDARRKGDTFNVIEH